MPHLRERHAFPLLLSKLKKSPAIFVQGVRQCGKSTLIRDLLAPKIQSVKYISLDQKNWRDNANTNPDSLLETYKNNLLAIDEAQKAPPLFDAIKFSIDNHRIPGKFILLGSSEFSKLNLIRESLTGRAMSIRLFPFNLAESLKISANSIKHFSLLNDNVTTEKFRVKRNEFLRYLERGGLPGIFAMRSDQDRIDAINSWLQLTIERDALLFPKLKIDPDVLWNLVNLIAKESEPEAKIFSTKLRKDYRIIDRHLNVLKALFVIHELPSNENGSGASRYFLCDVAIATLLGADQHRQLQTWILNEYLSQYSYRNIFNDYQFSYYRSSKGKIVDLVITSRKADRTACAIKLYTFEDINLRDIEILEALKRKSSVKTELHAFYPGINSMKLKNVSIHPWESIG